MLGLVAAWRAVAAARCLRDRRELPAGGTQVRRPAPMSSWRTRPGRGAAALLSQRESVVGPGRMRDRGRRRPPPHAVADVAVRNAQALERSARVVRGTLVRPYT